MKGGHHQHSNGAPDCPKARAAQGGVLGRQTQAFVLACADRRAPSVQPDPTVSLTTGSCDKNQLKHLNPVWFSHPAAAAWTVASERVLGAALACRGSHTAANTKRTCEVHGKPFLLSWSDTTGNRRVRHAHRTHTGLHAAAPNSSVRKHLSVCVCACTDDIYIFKFQSGGESKSCFIHDISELTNNSLQVDDPAAAHVTCGSCPDIQRPP